MKHTKQLSALLALAASAGLCSCSSSSGVTPSPTPTPPPLTYDITATWDANPEKDIAGYQLYEVVGTTNVKVGPLINGVTETVSSVPAGTHTYVITAQNTGGLVSPTSVPVPVSLPFPPSKPTNLGITWKLHTP